jgi:hypothetical protein
MKCAPTSSPSISTTGDLTLIFECPDAIVRTCFHDGTEVDATELVTADAILGFRASTTDDPMREVSLFRYTAVENEEVNCDEGRYVGGTGNIKVIVRSKRMLVERFERRLIVR